MPAKFRKVYASIWSDEDFLDLPMPAQWAYLMLISQPEISFAGVLAYRPKRWAAMISEEVEVVEAAVRQLEARRFVVVDRRTEEILVRSVMRYDGVFSSPNLLTASARSVEDVRSKSLLSAIEKEVPEHLRERFRERRGNPSANPSSNPSANPSGVENRLADNRLVGGIKHHRAVTATGLNQAGGRGGEFRNGAFDAFWDRWPEARRTGRPSAQQAWKAARNHGASEVDILEGLDRWARHWADTGTDPAYIPKPTNWLRDQTWSDPPPPPKRTKAQQRDDELLRLLTDTESDDQ